MARIAISWRDRRVTRGNTSQLPSWP